MTSRLRNSRSRSTGLLDAISSPRVTPGMISCATGLLLLIVTTLVVRPMQLPSAAAAAAAAPAAAAAGRPATVVVTASISSCTAPPTVRADVTAAADYILHEAAAAAASDPPALALAAATLEVECAFEIGSHTLTAAAATAAAAPHAPVLKLKSRPQQQPQGLHQQLQVVGVDVITCAMHVKYPQLHHQQRYTFLLQRADNGAVGYDYHVVEYAPLPDDSISSSSSSSSEAVLLQVLQRWGHAAHPSGCFKQPATATATPAVTSTARQFEVAQPTTADSASATKHSRMSKVLTGPPVATTMTVKGHPDAGPSSFSYSRVQFSDQMVEKAAATAAKPVPVPQEVQPQRRSILQESPPPPPPLPPPPPPSGSPASDGGSEFSPSPSPAASPSPQPSPPPPPPSPPSPPPTPPSPPPPPPPSRPPSPPPSSPPNQEDTNPTLRSSSSNAPSPPSRLDTTTQNSTRNSTIDAADRAVADDGATPREGDEPSVVAADGPPVSAAVLCSLPAAEVGPCRASIARWSYDAATGTCRRFTWGGCQGSDNKFESQQLCMTTCAAAMTAAAAPPAASTAAPWNTQQMPDAWIVDGAAQQAPAPQASSAGAVADVFLMGKALGVLLMAVLFLCVIAP